MKTAISLILAATLTALGLAQTAIPALPLATEHKKLEIWLGDWSYESTLHESPLGAAGTYNGNYTVLPILGGKCVEFRGEETGTAGSLHWVETDSYDPVNQRYRWNGFASDGSINDVTYSFDGPVAAYSGTMTTGAKRYHIRGSITFADDAQSFTDQREISTDGTTWSPLSEVRATKLTRVLAAAVSPEEELIELEKTWAAAYVAADVKVLERLEADEWICTTAKGEVFNKADDLREVADGSFKATSFEMSDLKVQVHGDTAIVTGRQTEKATYKGEDVSAVHRITDVWLFRDGRWQAIASHLSREAATPAAP